MCEGQISASLRINPKSVANDSTTKMPTATSPQSVTSTDKGATAQYLEIENDGPHQSEHYRGTAISNISGVNVD